MSQAELFPVETPAPAPDTDSLVAQTNLLASTKRSDAGTLNPNEAPPGYFAIRKSEARAETKGANICRSCDWRPRCDGRTYRCMSYAMICADTGRELSRGDGCSVVFKRRANS